MGNSPSLLGDSESKELIDGYTLSNLEEYLNHPTLINELKIYDEIQQDYLHKLKERGLSLESSYASQSRAKPLRKRLKDRGAHFTNGGASISINSLSNACDACVNDTANRIFYVTLDSIRNCQFCCKPAKANQQQANRHISDWEEELDELVESGQPITHFALTGGEPLLEKDETLKFFDRIRQDYPDAYTRLYTSGDLLDEEFLSRLSSSGLIELRFNINPDYDRAYHDEMFDTLYLAKRYIPVVIAEISVLPESTDEMKILLSEFDCAGIDGVNLLEFSLPLDALDEYSKRGFEVKNPPFDVLFDYECSENLPIARSEESCLQLIEYALDKELSLGVHYCSMTNKHRKEIFQRNHAHPFYDKCYEISAEDSFIKTIKVFDDDIDFVVSYLEGHGLKDYRITNEPRSLSFHPRYLPLIEKLSVIPVCSHNVLIERDGQLFLRELMLELNQELPYFS